MKVDIVTKAKNVVPSFSGTKDQVTVNDLNLTADQASTLCSLIRTDKEAELTVTIKN